MSSRSNHLSRIFPLTKVLLFPHYISLQTSFKKYTVLQRVNCFIFFSKGILDIRQPLKYRSIFKCQGKNIHGCYQLLTSKFFNLKFSEMML